MKVIAAAQRILRPSEGDVSEYRVVVELCGCLADPYGRQVAVICREAQMPVDRLITQLLEDYPALMALKQGRMLRACVNEVLVSDDHLVGMGDEIALFPPVSGG